MYKLAVWQQGLDGNEWWEIYHYKTVDEAEECEKDFAKQLEWDVSQEFILDYYIAIEEEYPE